MKTNEGVIEELFKLIDVHGPCVVDFTDFGNLSVKPVNASLRYEIQINQQECGAV
jgi:hypothetical protein